jgi:hypothetical protein
MKALRFTSTASTNITRLEAKAGVEVLDEGGDQPTRNGPLF